ncbi:MAG: hypothetical protein LBR89_01645 [Holosporales bacterium]|jgi:hypothetical protein|nr:hypothetical protein [Holosporales bacterium]
MYSKNIKWLIAGLVASLATNLNASRQDMLELANRLHGIETSDEYAEKRGLATTSTNECYLWWEMPRIYGDAAIQRLPVQAIEALDTFLLKGLPDDQVNALAMAIATAMVTNEQSWLGIERYMCEHLIKNGTMDLERSTWDLRNNVESCCRKLFKQKLLPFVAPVVYNIALARPLPDDIARELAMTAFPMGQYYPTDWFCQVLTDALFTKSILNHNSFSLRLYRPGNVLRPIQCGEIGLTDYSYNDLPRRSKSEIYTRCKPYADQIREFMYPIGENSDYRHLHTLMPVFTHHSPDYTGEEEGEGEEYELKQAQKQAQKRHDVRQQMWGAFLLKYCPQISQQEWQWPNVPQTLIDRWYTAFADELCSRIREIRPTHEQYVRPALESLSCVPCATCPPDLFWDMHNKPYICEAWRPAVYQAWMSAWIQTCK